MTKYICILLCLTAFATPTAARAAEDKKSPLSNFATSFDFGGHDHRNEVIPEVEGCKLRLIVSKPEACERGGGHDRAVKLIDMSKIDFDSVRVFNSSHSDMLPTRVTLRPSRAHQAYQQSVAFRYQEYLANKRVSQSEGPADRFLEAVDLNAMAHFSLFAQCDGRTGATITAGVAVLQINSEDHDAIRSSLKAISEFCAPETSIWRPFASLWSALKAMRETYPD